MHNGDEMNAYELADYAKEIGTTIEALEWVQKASPLLIQQAKEIERLIGSEPITYGMLTFCKNCGEQNPYYTATRELSDEEIDLFTKQFFNIWIGAELSEQFRIKLYELEDFARAILKKASEK
jgi:hypothetical protein